MPECQAGIGVAAGIVLAGNIGAYERFEYTVIGEPVNIAARLCELAKTEPHGILASAPTVQAGDAYEQTMWEPGRQVVLRGHGKRTRLASPRPAPHRVDNSAMCASQPKIDGSSQ